MKNLTIGFLFIFFLASCGKDDATPNEEKSTPLKVSRAIFSLNSILQKKQTATYISIRYWKEENLSNSDEVSLVVNGISAKLIKQTPNEILTGSNALFEIPAMNITGEVKATYSIKSANKTYLGEKTLRYVDDYNIATVWEKLDKDYVLQNPHRTLIDKNGTFQVSGATVTPEPLGIGLGIYGNMRTTAVTQVSPLFISGLNGAYGLRYDNNRTLTAIEIALGDENVDQSFDKNATLIDIANVYGTAVTNNLGKKIYTSGAFDIEVNVNSPTPTATIKKVRNIQ